MAHVKCLLLVEEDLNQSSDTPWIPYKCNLSNNCLFRIFWICVQCFNASSEFLTNGFQKQNWTESTQIQALALLLKSTCTVQVL